MKHWSGARRVLAVGAAALIACLPPATQAAGEPFEINAIVPETGPAAFLGKEEAQAFQVVEGVVNRAGGINGRPIKFVIADDQSVAATSVQLMNTVMAKKVAVVFGSSIASLCNAMSPLAKNGPVMYCLSPGIHPADGSYTFSANIATGDLLTAAAKYFNSRGWHKIALIVSNDATGQDAERGIDAAFNASSGATIVDRQYFNAGDVSASAQLAHIKASGAQALIAWSTGTPIATIFRSISDVGLDLPVLTTAGNATYAQMKTYAAFLPKTLMFSMMPSLAPDQIPNGPVKRALNAYFDAFKAIGVRPDTSQALVWDPVMLVVDALRKYGTNATAAQIRDYLDAQRSWAGITGVYDFKAKPQRGVGAANAVIGRWDAAKGTWVALSKLGGDPL